MVSLKNTKKELRNHQCKAINNSLFYSEKETKLHNSQTKTLLISRDMIMDTFSFQVTCHCCSFRDEEDTFGSKL